MYDRLSVSGILRGIGGALAHARLSLVALAMVLHLVGLVITGERWRVVIAALGSPLPLHRTTLINLAGIFVRNTTPTTGLGGDASRVALLRAEGVPLARATASFAYVRLAEVPPLGLIVALTAPAVATLLSRSKTSLIVSAGALALAAVVFWCARQRLRAQVTSIWLRSAHLRIDRTAASLAVFYATLAQMETLARQIVIAAAFGMPLTIEQSATVTAMTIAGGLVPTVGSIGAIDGSMVAGLMVFGASAQTAVAMTIVGRAISYALSTAAGAVALAVLGGPSLVRAVMRTASDPESAAG